MRGRDKKTMKWEYMELLPEWKRGCGDTWRVNGSEDDALGSKRLYEVLNALGQSGWELMLVMKNDAHPDGPHPYGIIPDDQFSRGVYLLLKRPLPSEQGFFTSEQGA